jgi:hypothetical protein
MRGLLGPFLQPHPENQSGAAAPALVGSAGGLRLHVIWDSSIANAASPSSGR